MCSLFQTLQFQTAAFVKPLQGHGDWMLSVFTDGITNRFDINVVRRDPNYVSVAESIGYAIDQVDRYAIEHDLTHHWVADTMGWPHSYSLYSAGQRQIQNLPYHSPNGETWSDRVREEEHMVNKLQRFVRLGTPDEFGVIQTKFDLELAKSELKSIWRRIN